MTCHTYLQDFGSQAAHVSAAAIDALHVRAGIDHPVSGDALAKLTAGTYLGDRMSQPTQHPAARPLTIVTKSYSIIGVDETEGAWEITTDTLHSVARIIEKVVAPKLQLDTSEDQQAYAEAIALLKRNRYYPARRHLYELGILLDINAKIERSTA